MRRVDELNIGEHILGRTARLRSIRQADIVASSDGRREEGKKTKERYTIYEPTSRLPNVPINARKIIRCSVKMSGTRLKLRFIASADIRGM